MRSMINDFTSVAALVVVVFIFALAWRGPFVKADAAQAPLQAQILQELK
ncbi:MAG TPA: hypothetical protein VMT38_00485 [Terracidiphilus sp.]|nr:hypothetical protein [Terracidiphilus sp.]